MAKVDVIPTKLLWVDLEMTGLDAEKDVILEIAAIITDFDFEPLATYEAFVQGGSRQIIEERIRQNPFWTEYPQNRDAFMNKLDTAKPLKVVEDELLNIIGEHFNNDPVMLAGNSIHMDRSFIKRWWPSLDQSMHYRMLDVSAFKILMQGKYNLAFEKKEVHRALDDIQASISELEYYLHWFKENT